MSDQQNKLLTHDRGARIRARSTSREQSIARILDATMEVIAHRGLEKLSLTDVCQQGGVSRTTLYRHFPAKEDLLDAFFSRETARYEAMVQQAVDAAPAPADRLRAVTGFLVSQPEAEWAMRLLQIEPGFVLQFLTRYRSHRCEVMIKALEPVFDQAERNSGVRIDRAMVAELIVRVQISLYLVPSESGAAAVTAGLNALFEQLPGWPSPDDSAGG